MRNPATRQDIKERISNTNAITPEATHGQEKQEMKTNHPGATITQLETLDEEEMMVKIPMITTLTHGEGSKSNTGEQIVSHHQDLIREHKYQPQGTLNFTEEPQRHRQLQHQYR